MTVTTSVDPDNLELTNLAAPVMFTNPYPRYAELRRSAPVSRVKVPMVVRGTGYMLTRYEDVALLHSDPRFSTDVMTNGGMGKYKWLLPPTLRLLQNSLPFRDDPDHRRLRTLVHKAFTPKLVMGMNDDIAKISAELIDGLAAKGNVDLIDDFAIRLPLAVISNMLGVNEADREKFHGWSNDLSRSSGSGILGMLKLLPVSSHLLKFFDHLATQARRNPDDGLISALVQANEDGEKLSDREVLAMIFVLLLAGHDTTANLIGNGMLALLDHPDQLAKLRENPELIDSAIEELLRFTTPVACGVTRIALEDIDIAGVRIPKGSQVLGMIISANRDENVFPDADKLDITREPNKHLAFAFGPHYCLGHQLARSEGKIALRGLIERFDTLELNADRSKMRYKEHAPLRGLRSLPMRVS